MSWQTLNTKLKQKIEGISRIKSSYAYPTEKFDAFPAATLTPSELEANFQTTAENVRNYAFIIRLFQDIPNENISGEKPLEYSFRVLRQVTDDVIDTFDQDPLLSGISMPSNYTLLDTQAVPSSWGLVESGDKRLLMSEVTVTIKVSFDYT